MTDRYVGPRSGLFSHFGKLKATDLPLDTSNTASLRVLESSWPEPSQALVLQYGSTDLGAKDINSFDYLICFPLLLRFRRPFRL
jgi:hypothetical protein